MLRVGFNGVCRRGRAQRGDHQHAAKYNIIKHNVFFGQLFSSSLLSLSHFKPNAFMMPFCQRVFYGASEEMNTDESWRINSTNIHLLFFHHFLSLSARTPAAGGNYDQTEKKTKSTVCFLLLSVSLISFNLFLLYFLFLVSFCAFRL